MFNEFALRFSYVGQIAKDLKKLNTEMKFKHALPILTLRPH